MSGYQLYSYEDVVPMCSGNDVFIGEINLIAEDGYICERATIT